MKKTIKIVNDEIYSDCECKLNVNTEHLKSGKYKYNRMGSINLFLMKNVYYPKSEFQHKYHNSSEIILNNKRCRC